jgi:hypothetical protein
MTIDSNTAVNTFNNFFKLNPKSEKTQIADIQDEVIKAAQDGVITDQEKASLEAKVDPAQKSLLNKVLTDAARIVNEEFNEIKPGDRANVVKANAGYNILNQLFYGNPLAIGYNSGLSLNKDTPVSFSKISDPANKQNLAGVLSSYYQVNQLDPSSKDQCGAATVVAGVLYSQGDKGLCKLIDAIAKEGKNQLVDISGLEEIRAKLVAGKDLTYGDLSKIQDTLYKVLDTQETLAGDSRPGLFNESLGNFINKYPELKSMFDTAGISIRNIDTDGNGSENHFVLEFKYNNKPAFYDPFPIGDGNKQFITNPAVVQHYRQYADITGSVAYP